MIIANIEREFLTQEDTKLVHFYFSAHRKNNNMISHLKIQFALAIGIASIVLYYHFSVRVFDGLQSPISSFKPERALPYIIGLIGIVFLYKQQKTKNKSYDEFVERSPGREIQSAAEGTISHGQH